MILFIPFCCCDTSSSSSSSSTPRSASSSSSSKSSSSSSSSSSLSSSSSSRSGTRPCSCSSAPGAPGEFNGQTFVQSCRFGEVEGNPICSGGVCIVTWVEPDPIGDPGIGSWVQTTDTCSGITV